MKIVKKLSLIVALFSGVALLLGSMATNVIGGCQLENEYTHEVTSRNPEDATISFDCVNISVNGIVISGLNVETENSFRLSEDVPNRTWKLEGIDPKSGVEVKISGILNPSITKYIDDLLPFIWGLFIICLATFGVAVIIIRRKEKTSARPPTNGILTR